MSKKTIRIGHLSTFYHTAILLSGKFDLGLELEFEADWKLFGTGPAIVDAFERGELDIAYMGLPPAIIGMARGVQIKCIAGGHTEGTVLVGKDVSFTSGDTESLHAVLSKFKGKSIAVPGKGSIHDVIARHFLNKFSLAEDISIINFRWADEIVEEMAAGRINAAIGTPALAVSARRFAGASLLCPARMLWPDNPSYGIVADRSFLNIEGNLADKFLRLHEQANEIIRNQPIRASEAIAETVGVVDSDFVLEVLKISPRYCSQLSGGFTGSTMEFVKAMVDLGYLKEPIEEDRIFDSTYISRTHPPGDHYGDGLII